jgi:hypothetical protein
MASRGTSPALRSERLLVGDAAELDLPVGGFDLIVSEDVFEHVTPDALQQLVPKVAAWLKPSGLALIRPMIYTGIAGSHLVDWYPHRVLSGQASGPGAPTEPWEHLRQGRQRANTYLNQLTRAHYRALFGEYFVIEEERVRHPDLGRHLLTPRIAAELAEWSDDELFSNSVQFVLRPR